MAGYSLWGLTKIQTQLKQVSIHSRPLPKRELYTFNHKFKNTLTGPENRKQGKALYNSTPMALFSCFFEQGACIFILSWVGKLCSNASCLRVSLCVTVASGDQGREQFTPGRKVTYCLLTSLIYLCLQSVCTGSSCLLFLVLEDERTGDSWPADWPGEKGCVLNGQQRAKRAASQGAYLSALLKATFCSYVSPKKEVPPFEDCSLCSK